MTIPFTQLKNKKILLLGYGIEGKSTEAFLKKHIPNANIGIADQTQGADYLEKQKYFDLAIRSPGIHKSKVKIPYTTATNIFFELVRGKTIGITGTKGKSTTTKLIYELLKAAGLPVTIAGNIGKPMLESFDPINNREQIFVLELSSFQLDDIEFSPDISAVINLYSDHFDYHGSIEAYHNAKHCITAKAGENSSFFYHGGFAKLQNWAQNFPGKYYDFAHEDISKYSLSASLEGQHYANDVRVAVAIAKHFGVDDSTIQTVLKNFKGLPHRLEYIGTYKNIRFYDDAISTTPESTIFAIQTIENIDTLLLGGTDRNYSFDELAQQIKNYSIRNIVLFPDSGHRIRLLISSLEDITITETSSMQEAVQFAFEHSSSSSACLLSTASPSYSIWKNFVDKGNQFQKWVRYYGNQEEKKQKSNSRTKRKT